MAIKTFKVTTLCAASAVFLSACQVETTSRAANEAPKSEPIAAAAPVVASAAQSQGVVLTGRTATASGSWSNSRSSSMGPKSGVAFAAKAINLNGETAICGVRAARGVGSRRFNSQVANKYGFYIGDQLMLSNIAYFSQASSIEAMGSTAARCKTTGIPWQDAFAKAPWELKYGGGSRFSF